MKVNNYKMNTRPYLLLDFITNVSLYLLSQSYPTCLSISLFFGKYFNLFIWLYHQVLGAACGAFFFFGGMWIRSVAKDLTVSLVMGA